MDGKTDTVNTPPLEAPAAPKIQTFQCPGCGAPLTVRGMQQTQSIACGSCGSVVDITDENFRIIDTFQSKVKVQPLIPLGSRGKLRGELFEVIGFLQRTITVEGVDYTWSEYLLFNPYKGFRWLSEYNGHWSYIKTTTQIPNRKAGSAAVNYLGHTFLHFQTADARVSYVLGEFYWRVQVGEVCEVADFVSPPLILSMERSEAEVTWSIAEYIEPKILWEAFQLKTSIPPKVGIAPNQPSKLVSLSPQLWKRWGIFFLAILLVQVIFLLMSANQLVFQDAFAFHLAEKERARVTPVFELTGRPSNVVIRSKATVDNSWIYLSLALINEETGNGYDFGREISYYHGRDGGESWSEGSSSDEAVLPSVPAGRYYLRIEPEAEASSVNYSIQVYRDVPNWTFFFLALGGLLIFPIFYWWRRRTFEYHRWSESDHPMRSLSSYVSSSHED
jgi:Domain of unknown function (DUF4178)